MRAREKGKPRAQGEEKGMEVHIEREGRQITAEDEDEVERIKERWRWRERDNRETKQEEREEALVAHGSGSSLVWRNPLGPMVEQTLISLFNDPTADLMTPA